MKIILSLLLSLSIGTSFGGAFTTYSTSNGLMNNSVNCIEQGSRFIWIGTNRGINRIVFEGTKPVKISPRGTSVPVTCIEDDNEIIWVGLKGRGVYRMPKKNYKFLGFRKDILGDKTVISIKKNTTTVEIITSEKKKYTFDIGKVTYKEESVALPQNKIDFKSNNKNIQLQKGVLVRYNDATKSYRSFAKKISPTQGLGFKEGYLMATKNGLVYYSPSSDTIKFESPSFALANFSLNGTDTIANKLDLGWDEHVFHYNFNYTELGDKENIKLTYQVTGTKSLTETVNAAKGIVLKDLEYGSYQITITAENTLGIKASNEITYSFSIANPLKDSIWEYLFIVAVILIWTLLIIKIVASKYKKNILILEDALLEKTNRLNKIELGKYNFCLLYTSPSPRDGLLSRMPSSA